MKQFSKSLVLLLCLTSLNYQITAQEFHSKAKEKIFNFVDQMPQFPGGEKAMFAFIINKIKYPKKAKRHNIEGSSVVQFVIDTAGNVVLPKIIRSLSPDCDAEVLRVLSIMPKWSPGRSEGETVNVSFTLPVRFKLEN